MNIVIVGAGRVGSRVAENLAGANHVTVIDKAPEAFERLPPGFTGRTVLGNGIDIDVLREAGCDGCDVFLALTEFDNSNIMAAEAAQTLGARRIVARVYDPVRGRTFGKRGITTVSPTLNGAAHLFEMLTGEEAS